MKVLLVAVFVGLVAVIESASVGSASNDRDAAVLRSESDVQPEGFNYVYETNNGIAAQATGALKGDAINVQGSYKYTSPEGVPVEVSYTADEFGYKPVGDSIPVGPPTPASILRALEYIAAHPPKDTYKQ